MIDTTKLKASDGTGNAVLAHVTIARLAGATVLKVDSVSKWNTASFIATVGTLGSDGFMTPASITEFTGHITAGDIIIDSFEPGFSDLGNTVGQVVVVKQTTGWANYVQSVVSELQLEDQLRATHYGADFIQTGGIWSISSLLVGTMTAVTAYQAGQRATLAAIATRTFTALKDTYVDLLRGGTAIAPTFTAVYTEVANGAAAPALAANSIRLALVVTNATTITTIRQNGFDSLNNRIYPNSPVATKQTGLWYEELGRATATGTVTSLSVDSIPPRRYMKILIFMNPAAAILSAGVRYNNDATGGNYAYRVADNGGADTTGTFAGIPVDAAGGVANFIQAELEVINFSGMEKITHGHVVDTGVGSGSANVPKRRETVGKWVNTGLITSVQLFATASSLAVGSEIVVLGHD